MVIEENGFRQDLIAPSVVNIIGKYDALPPREISVINAHALCLSPIRVLGLALKGEADPQKVAHLFVPQSLEEITQLWGTPPKEGNNDFLGRVIRVTRQREELIRSGIQEKELSNYLSPEDDEFLNALKKVQLDFDVVNGIIAALNVAQSYLPEKKGLEKNNDRRGFMDRFKQAIIMDEDEMESKRLYRLRENIGLALKSGLREIGGFVSLFNISFALSEVGTYADNVGINEQIDDAIQNAYRKAPAAS